MAPFNETERRALLDRIADIQSRRYPEDRSKSPPKPEANRLRDEYLQCIAEYSDRLPRILMSVSPHDGAALKRCFDPFGFDGLWWHSSPVCRLDEPKPPADFQVLLGAVRLRREAPTEVRKQVLPGPEVPFVVPRLLELPGMVAVIGEIELATGDIAYPIAYFSTAALEPASLHQSWCRSEAWFESERGDSWFIANDTWDFELEPWVASGKVRWVDLSQDAPVVQDGKDGKDGTPCPFAGLEGERRPQVFASGRRSYAELPTGQPINPFE